MNVGIFYSSNSGNTQKVAQAFATSLSTQEVFAIGEGMKLKNDYDIYFIGGWINQGELDQTCLHFIQSLQNKPLVIFFTLGANSKSTYAQSVLARVKKQCESYPILGYFFCQGAIDPQWIARMKCYGVVDEARIKLWEEAKKHPSVEELQAAQQFAQNIWEVYSK